MTSRATQPSYAAWVISARVSLSRRADGWSFLRMLASRRLPPRFPERSIAMRVHALLLGAALLSYVASAPAIAEQAIRQPVDLALVLLTDVSNSMDDREYALVKEGYKAAFSDPEIIQAILSNSKGIAVSYVEFAGKDEFFVVKGWD